MRFVLVIALAACGSKQPVVIWSTSGTEVAERIEVQSSGHITYTTTINGVPDKRDEVILTSDQVEEIDELFRNQHVCELANDPAYTPTADEGKTTLVLAFPDQRCTVELWNHEWNHGRAQPVAETMRSMRPLRPHTGRVR